MISFSLLSVMPKAAKSKIAGVLHPSVVFCTDSGYNLRLFQNFSFGTTTLDLIKKAGFRPLFR
jgi:putative hemolysin